MFGLGKHGPDARYAAIIDVGSGSVGTAIVASEPNTDKPGIIYSAREWTNIRDIESVEDASKDITTAVMNAFLELGSLGGKALREYDPHAKILHVFASISAPWSYTITQTVSTSDEKSFTITKSLLSELVETARVDALKVLDANDFMQKMGLEIISDVTVSVLANGYRTNDPIGQSVTSATVSHLSGITERKLLQTIEDAQDKVFKSAKLETSTFMYHYHLTLQNLLPETTEICLIDVTAEATEIGIVRDGVLRYVTHIPHGTHTIAREISGLCKITKAEALGYIRQNATDLKTSLSSTKQKEIDVVIELYEQQLADLLRRTGDALAIPKTIFLHTDIHTEQFFSDCLQRAGLLANKVEHTVHPITSKLFPDTNSQDTGILVSAYVFHNRLYEQTIDD